MFSSQTPKEPKDRKPVREASGTPSIVSADVKIKGDLSSPGEVQFDGTIEGDLSCGTVTVGEHAHVTGTIAADKVVVHGTVNGSIRGRIIHLHNTSKVTGDLLHEDLTIDSGAFVEGRCLHVENPLEDKAQKRANVAETFADAPKGANGPKGNGTAKPDDAAKEQQKEAVGT